MMFFSLNILSQVCFQSTDQSASVLLSSLMGGIPIAKEGGSSNTRMTSCVSPLKRVQRFLKKQ